MGQERQNIIDALIDHIDTAIKKGSVTNQQVAAVLYFLNERLKELSGYDIEELAKTFLRKDRPDATDFLMRLLGGVEIGQFIQGMIGGSGARIDERGNLEAESGTFRSSLRVLELIYNRITVNDGKHIWSAGGTIKKCEQQTETSYLLYFDKYHETDFLQFKPDDILLGNFNQTGGFFNSYMRVANVDAADNTALVVVAHDTAVPSGQNYPPCELMHLARIGNFTDPERQNSIYLDAELLQFCMLGGVDDYIIKPTDKKSFIGILDSPRDLGLPETLPVQKGDLVGFFDILLAKNFIQVDERDQIIKKQVDRDAWVSDPVDPSGNSWPYINNSYEVHYVWIYNCRWKCIVPEATKGLKPGWDNPEWVAVSGDTTLKLVIESSNGWIFRPAKVDTTLSATVWRGSENITKAINDNDWQWARETGDPLGDTSWNAKYSKATGAIHITFENGDMGNKWPADDVKFTCTAYVRIGDEVLTLSKSKSFKRL